ncbi:MAG: PAS domain S-box protein [Gammaproteobacteria bacterium]|jgi:PAS domain S-box-containing protein
MAGLNPELNRFEILESIPDALLITDASGNVAFVNAQLLTLFGYTPEEMTEISLDQLMPERFRPAHPSHVVEYAKDPYVRPMGDCSGFYAVTKSGREFPVEIYLSPFYSGDELFVMAAIRDIGQRKQLEEALRRSRDDLEEQVRLRTAELEDTSDHLRTEMREHARSEERILQLQAELSHISRLSMLGEMSSGLGHELNQPLAAINNYAQGCIRRIQGGSTDHKGLIDALQRISREAARASDIIARFRRFAKKEELQRDWVNVDTLVCDAVRLSELDSAKHGIEVDLHLNGVLPQAYIDAIQIQQVMVNLIRNAIEATIDVGDAQKAVSVRVSKLANDSIKIAVVDHGHGLVAESVDHLFQPFFTTKSNGLGMGLSLSHRIITAHGGELSAQSNDDRGMTFSLVLPVTDTASYDA